jgi:hypothetical protein
MTFSAQFRCIAGCAGGHALDEVLPLSELR